MIRAGKDTELLLSSIIDIRIIHCTTRETFRTENRSIDGTFHYSDQMIVAYLFATLKVVFKVTSTCPLVMKRVPRLYEFVLHL